jgi:hypothetical protein
MMPCLIFSPDKSEKLLKGLTIFVKRPAGFFLPYKKAATRKTCNEYGLALQIN